MLREGGDNTIVKVSWDSTKMSHNTHSNDIIESIPYLKTMVNLDDPTPAVPQTSTQPVTLDKRAFALSIDWVTRMSGTSIHIWHSRCPNYSQIIHTSQCTTEACRLRVGAESKAELCHLQRRQVTVRPSIRQRCSERRKPSTTNPPL